MSNLHTQDQVVTSLHKEIELAHRVQHGLLPQAPPNVAGLDIGAALQSAYRVGEYGVGGDFYDFLPSRRYMLTSNDHANSLTGDMLEDNPSLNSRPVTNDAFTFIVGDICGKGLAASILMSMTRIVLRMVTLELRENTSTGVDPAIIIDHANSILYDEFSNIGVFATVFVGSYDPVTQLLVYANAGHSPAIYIQAQRGETCGYSRLLTADGTPLGVLPVSENASRRHPKNHYLHFRSGDVLLIGTDGLLGGLDQSGSSSAGYDQLLKRVETIADYPAHSIVEYMINRSDQPNDDIISDHHNNQELVESSKLNRDQMGHSNPPKDDQALVVIKNTSELLQSPHPAQKFPNLDIRAFQNK